MSKVESCYHCGDACTQFDILHDDKHFCCHGCKTVYEIFSENNLDCYYDLTTSPGSTPIDIAGKFDFIDQEEIKDKLVDFSDGTTEVVSLYIPHIHCSSCIWILENLNKLNPAIRQSQVNFPKKIINITYKTDGVSLKKVVELLTSIGYEPYISLDNIDKKEVAIDNSLIYKIAVAGFAFGNVMFLSFPEYFQVSEFWLNQYKILFRWLMFAFSLPVVFYAGRDYYISAYKGLRSKMLNIDVPIALGITVLFLRSFVDVAFNFGSGFFDSLTGLVFFLLLGRFVQQKTYSYLSFERDYKSYFPIAITKINADKTEENIEVYKIKEGDRLLIRNEELIPVDSILMTEFCEVDYSFVTGEADPVEKKSGDKLFAGGKLKGQAIEIVAEKSVEQSYLTQLWSNDVFQKDYNPRFQSLIDKISKRFTIAVLSIATSALIFWLFYQPNMALNVFTAVLIIACPCAIALATPFTLGNLLRIFGQHGFYMKNIISLEQLASIDIFVFDKTGTISSSQKSQISYKGEALSEKDLGVLKDSFRNSNHPLSRQLYVYLNASPTEAIDGFDEHLGLGITSTAQANAYKLGSASFVEAEAELINPTETSVFIQKNNRVLGKFIFDTVYREGLVELFEALDQDYKLAILSGDNSGEKQYLSKLLPKTIQMKFNQKPDSKMRFVEKLQDEGKSVCMLGDGLNDAGALKQADVGIAISENVNVFSPACDAIMSADQFKNFDKFLKVSKKGIFIIKLSFMFSFLYNSVGIYFAVSGLLRPVIAAILMPLSSISIVAFTTLATTYACRKTLNFKV
ncbi:MAG: heavy metal translocating P-type ATPase [Flavobacteriaceae bacterium]|nr:heavy metal translocating P-type ATPase metal-binding domain-containing protein [Psychroflexus sp.]